MGYMVIVVDKKEKYKVATLDEARAQADRLFEREVGYSKKDFLAKACHSLGMGEAEAQKDFQNVLMDAGIYLAKLDEKDGKYYIDRSLY